MVDNMAFNKDESSAYDEINDLRRNDYNDNYNKLDPADMKKEDHPYDKILV